MFLYACGAAGSDKEIGERSIYKMYCLKMFVVIQWMIDKH